MNTCNDIVCFHSSIVVRHMPPPSISQFSFPPPSSLVNWTHDGKLGGKVRCYFEQRVPFRQSLLHQLVLLIVQVKHRLLQVSHTTVNQFCGLAGGA